MQRPKPVVESERVLPPNTPAPELSIPDCNGRPVKLSDYRGRNVVLAFYPGDWTPVCTSEMSLIQEVLDDVRGQGAEVLGISADTPSSHAAWASQINVTFPLLTDFWPHGNVAGRYGVFDDKEGLSERALFFIDSDGVVRDRWIAEDPAIAPGLSVIFEGLERLRAAPGARRADEVGGRPEKDEGHV